MNFCTLFDENYKGKGLALVHSIQTWCNGNVFVLDVSTKQDLEIPSVAVVHLSHIIDFKLAEAQGNRTNKEFLWTLASWWMWHLLYQGLPDLTYVDADTLFVYHPETLWDETRNCEIAICPHRVSPPYRENLRFNGIYNVGLVYIKNTPTGMKCASEWKDNCLEWCYDRHDDWRFGDQNYLDNWEKDYGAYPIQHLGVNLAPWNQLQYSYCLDDGILYVSDGERCDPLILYHFSEYGMLKKGKPILTNYPLHPMIAQHLYPYYEVQLGKSLA